jgi:RHS repeat-associated protein
MPALVAPRPPRERREPPRARVRAENRGPRRGAPSPRDRIRRRALQARGAHQESRRARPANTSGAPVYQYDALGNLRQVTLPNGDVITYLVDGMGRRVGKQVNGVLGQQWLWRGRLQPVAELDGAGNVVARYVYAANVNAPELMITAGATYRLVKDQVGTIRRVVDATSGGVVQEIVYDAWGRVLADTNPGFQPFGFAGGLADPDTELVRFGARDYEPEFGRWTSRDPARFAGGANHYAYVGDNPVNRGDPKGLDWLDDILDSLSCGVFGCSTNTPGAGSGSSSGASGADPSGRPFGMNQTDPAGGYQPGDYCPLGARCSFAARAYLERPPRL